MNAQSPALLLAYSSSTRQTKIHLPRLDVVHHRPSMSDGTSEHDATPATERHRSMVAAAIAELQKRGRIVSTCTIQAALHEHFKVMLSYREITEARRSREGVVRSFMATRPDARRTSSNTTMLTADAAQ